MAISVTTASFQVLTVDRSSTGFSTSKLFVSNSLRFPNQLWNLRSRKRGQFSVSQHRRIVPRVSAKKETFSSFDDLLANSDKPVLVDFYATWCGPCQFMVPVLEQVSAALKDKIRVVKIDTEKYTSIASKYNIEALPTFIIFKDGKPFDRFEGALAAEPLIERIEKVLSVKQ